MLSFSPFLFLDARRYFVVFGARVFEYKAPLGIIHSAAAVLYDKRHFRRLNFVVLLAARRVKDTATTDEFRASRGLIHNGTYPEELTA